MLSGGCQRHAEFVITTARVIFRIDTLRSAVIQHPRESLMSMYMLSFACTTLRLSMIKTSEVLAGLATLCLSPNSCHTYYCATSLHFTTLKHACVAHDSLLPTSLSHLSLSHVSVCVQEDSPAEICPQLCTLALRALSWPQAPQTSPHSPL